MMIMTVWTWVTILVFGYWVWTMSDKRPKKALGYVCLTSLCGLALVKTISFFVPLPFA